MSSLGSMRRRIERGAGPSQGTPGINLSDPGAPEKVFAGQRNPYASLYVDPASYLKPAAGERFEIRLFDISPREALKHRLSAILTGHGLGNLHDLFPGPQVVLFDRQAGRALMETGTHEQRTNAAAIIRARGNVLILGLGVAMVPVALAHKPEVERITVVEIEPEIIRLVGGQLGEDPTHRILEGDAFTWTPAPGELFDFIYADLWPAPDGPNNYSEIERLRVHYAPFLAHGGRFMAWCEDAALFAHYRATMSGAQE